MRVQIIGIFYAPDRPRYGGQSNVTQSICTIVGTRNLLWLDPDLLVRLRGREGAAVENLVDRIIRRSADPTLRRRIVRKVLKTFPFGSFETRLEVGAFECPWYAWCLYHAALEAKALGHAAITAVELGVASGNGLIQLCELQEKVRAETGIRTFIQGLDSGTGLPETSDARDLLYCWPAGSFPMDYVKLTQRLKGRADIVLGDVAQTTKQLSIRADAPLGAVLFDLDFFTSTRDAFALLEHPNVLPRVWCYFDDIVGTPEGVFSDYTGVRAAIRQFNSNRPETDDHLSKAYVFRHHYPEEWHQLIYVYHRMTHPDYNRFLNRQLMLDLA